MRGTGAGMVRIEGAAVHTADGLRVRWWHDLAVRGVAGGVQVLTDAVEQFLHSYRLRVGPIAGSTVVAVVPLVIHGTVVGAVVLLSLLSHRPPIDDEDREPQSRRPSASRSPA